MGLNYNANLVKRTMFTVGGFLCDELSLARGCFRSSFKNNNNNKIVLKEIKKRKSREIK